MNEVIDKLISNSKKAQGEIVTKKDDEINKIIINIIQYLLSDDLTKKFPKWLLMRQDLVMWDKIEKNKNKTLNLINEVLPVKTFKPYFEKNKKIHKFKPVGVICGSTPSTNPIATTLNYFINSIKFKNSLIICPNIIT